MGDVGLYFVVVIFLFLDIGIIVFVVIWGL